MRTFKYIVIHCTAGSQQATLNDLLREFRRKGWNNPGYHFLITANGKIHNLLPIQNIANGVQGFNNVSIHIAYTGGIDKNKKPIDNRTDAQKKSLATLVKVLHQKYPKATILGHRDFPNVHKDCPSFDVSEWLNTLNFD